MRSLACTETHGVPKPHKPTQNSTKANQKHPQNYTTEGCGGGLGLVLVGLGVWTDFETRGFQYRPATRCFNGTVTPTSYQYHHENISSGTQTSSIWGGLDGPGSPRNHSKRWGTLRPAVWNGFWEPRGRPDPKNKCLLGPGKISVHDCINTKWGLDRSPLQFCPATLLVAPPLSHPAQGHVTSPISTPQPPTIVASPGNP
jgi:hypothetical protein